MPRQQRHTSSASANEFDDLVSGWQSASLFLRIDFVAINENVECAWPAQANAGGNLQFAFDALFQAHGPSMDVTSKETALDLHSHSLLSQILPRIQTEGFIECLPYPLRRQKLLFIRIEFLPASNHSGGEMKGSRPTGSFPSRCRLFGTHPFAPTLFERLRLSYVEID